MADIVVGIDIGTTKVCTLIGRLKEDSKIETLGRGVAPCSGVKKGVIVDLESTAGSIANSIRQAENMAQLKVESAYINISGAHVDVIKTLNEISISNEDHEVTSQDVEKLLFMAGNTEVAKDRQIIDIIPNQYILDGYEEILDPTGMTGVKLALDADVVAGKLTSVQNIVRSIGKSGIKLDGFIVEALATASIALTSDEREIGAILIDIGGGVTDVSIFKRNRLIFYDSIPVGGDHITNDISIGLKIPAHEAEKLKKEYELALTSLINNDQEVSVTDGDTGRKKSVKVSEIVDIIEARVTEIFTLCRDRIADSGIYESLNAGVVLTGGGISYLQGAEQIAGSVFELPAKVANYKAYGITKPEHITSAGIVKHASERSKYSTVKSTTRVQKSEADGRKTGNTGILGKVFEFFRRLF